MTKSQDSPMSVSADRPERDLCDLGCGIVHTLSCDAPVYREVHEFVGRCTRHFHHSGDCEGGDHGQEGATIPETNPIAPNDITTADHPAADRPATAFLPSDVQLLRDVANTYNPDTFDEHNRLEDLADKIEEVLFPPAADRPVENSPCCPTWGNVAEEWGCCSNAFHIPRPVENSELREALYAYANAAFMNGREASVNGYCIPMDPLRSRIEELFASRTCADQDCGWYRTTVELRAEISRLRADQLTENQVDLIVDTVLHYGPAIAADVWEPIEAKLRASQGSGSQ